VRRAAACGWLAVAAIVLTLAMAAPVVLSPSTRIFGSGIVGTHYDPFVVMRQFAGQAVPAPYVQPATDWLGRALAWGLSPVAAYNVVVLWTFPAAAVCGYLLAFALTRSVMASAVAGLAFAFSPFHVAHAGYHPHVAQVQWIAAYLAALWWCLHGFSARKAVVLAIATALVVASNFYSGFIAMTLTPAIVPLFWISPSPDARATRTLRDLGWTAFTLIALAAAGLVAAALIIPGGLHAATLPRVAWGDLFRYSAKWWAHLVPPADHAVLGRFARAFWRAHDAGPGLLEQQVYLGFGLLALAAAGCWLAITRSWSPGPSGPANDRTVDGRTIAALVTIAAIALVCSLSPERTIAGWHIVRPSALLYRLAPMFRAYARFSVVVQLIVAILAGVGAEALWRSRARAARAAAIALLLVAVFEYAPVPWRSRDVLPTTAHRWLADRGVTSTVLDCSRALLSGVETSWLAGFPIRYLTAAEPDCGAPNLGVQLRAAGVADVIVRPNRREWTRLVEQPPAGLRLVYRGSDSAVLRVADGPAIPFATPAGGWYPREYEGRRTWQWSAGRASMIMVAPGTRSRRVALTLELTSFHAPRHVEARLDGAVVATWTVGVVAGRYRIGPIDLPPGRSDLTLVSREPPVAPAAIDADSTDRRVLAFVLGDWSMGEPPAGDER
jgi:hypothetical protein